MLLEYTGRVSSNKIWDYILVFLLIANSAIPFFYIYIEWKIIHLILVSVIFFNRNNKFDRLIFIYITSFLIICIGQYYIFGSFIITDFLSVAIRILIAYLTIKTVTIRFYPITVNLLYFFAISSIIFYLAANLISGFSNFVTTSITPYFNPPFQSKFKDAFNQLILYNFYSFDFRNSGPFWEPGTFGGFLIIALIINTLIKKKLFEKKNIVMAVALFTTLSTMAYILFALLLMTYIIFIQKRSNSLVALVPLAAVFILFFINTNFMENKILRQIGQTDMYYRAGKVGNRFVSAIVDLNEFYKYPIFGVRRGEISAELKTGFEEHRSNGIFHYLSNFGIFFFLFYFINLYKSLFRFCLLCGYTNFISYFLLFILILMGFSEDYFNHPFFYALTMLHCIIPKQLIIEVFNHNYWPLQSIMQSA